MISYIIEVSLCWAGFYGLYALLLRQTTFFNANRWYLIGTLLLGLTVPLMELPEAVPEAASAPVVYYLEPITVGVEQLEVTVTAGPAENGFDYYLLLRWIYGLGVLFFGIRFLYGLWEIFQLYRGARIEKYEGYTLVRTNRPHLPFSFFNWLFWSDKMRLESEDTRSVIRHEQAHINGGHSIDVLLLEILCVVLWCSPFVYLYRRSVRTVHEYLADKVVLKTTRRKKYGHLLLRQSQSGLQIALANHFFQTQLKQRIMMMTRHKTSRKALIRYLLALPLLVLFLLAFANRELIGQTLLEIHQADGTILHKEVQDIKEADQLFSPDEILSVQILKDKDLDKVVIRLKDAAAEEAPADQTSEEISASPETAPAESGVKLHINTGQEDETTEPDRILIISPDGTTEELDYDKELRILDYIDPNNIERVDVIKEEENIIKIYLKQPMASLSEAGNAPPRFPGCEELSDPAERDQCAQRKLLEFVYKNIKYPAAARDARKEGTVVVQFTIGEDGSVGQAKVMRDIGEGAGREVLRVINDMPRWIPARKDGKAVAAEFNLPVKFQLEDKNPDLAMIKTMDAVPEEEQKAPVYNEVEVMPRFPGCEEMEGTDEEKRACANQKLMQFFGEQIRYPQAAKEGQLQGPVVVQFTVFADGTIGDSKILRDIGGGAGEEALRVVEKMPEWTPGQQEGKAVAVRFTMPVMFKLNNDKQELPSPPAPVTADRSLKLASFSASPNPTAGMLNLQFQTEAGPTQIRVTDLAGRELLRRELDDFDGAFEGQLNLSRAAKGTVLLIIQQDERIFTEKIVLK